MGLSQTAEWEEWAARYARIALGAAFLSAVAGRFGLWGGHLNWDNFARFIERTRELNAFMPASTMPLLAWAWLFTLPGLLLTALGVPSSRKGAGYASIPGPVVLLLVAMYCGIPAAIETNRIAAEIFGQVTPTAAGSAING